MNLIYTVPQSHCVVVERLGKFSRIQTAGLNFRIPFIEKHRRVDIAGSAWGDTANKDGFQIELTEQRSDTPARTVYTKDNVKVQANASIYWKISDVRKSLYEVDSLPESLTDIALNALRSCVGEMSLDSLLSQRQEISQKISAQLSDNSAKWGVNIIKVEIQELATDEETTQAMLQQLEAERRKRATVAEAQGEAEAAVTVAEAEKSAEVLRAQGKAEALALISTAEREYLDRLRDAVGVENAGKILIAQKVLESYSVITGNPADKVFLPNNFQGVFSVPTDNSDRTDG